jgi:phage gpG-like protein
MIEVKWSKKSKAYFHSLPDRFIKGLSRGFRASAPTVRKSIRSQFGGPRQLKVRTGTLRDSIEYKISKDRKSNFDMASFFTDVIYGAVHEYGDLRRNMPERPYLEPGVRKKLSSVIREVERAVVKELER